MSYKNIFSLEGKGIVVTGGAGYLGSKIVEGLLDFGAKVSVAEIKEIEAKDVTAREDLWDRLFVIKCDLHDSVSIKNMFDEAERVMGCINGVINCAAYTGYAGTGTADTIPDEIWNEGIEGTLGITFKSIRESIPYLEKNGGSIINFGSLYAVGAPDFRTYEGTDFISPPNYGAGKAAIVQLTRHCASQFAKKNIRVNSITPGSFPHPPTQAHEVFKKRLGDKTMLGRIGYPDDLVGVAVLLISDAASYITGANYVVDGGQTAW